MKWGIRKKKINSVEDIKPKSPNEHVLVVDMSDGRSKKQRAWDNHYSKHIPSVINDVRKDLNNPKKLHPILKNTNDKIDALNAKYKNPFDPKELSDPKELFSIRWINKTPKHIVDKYFKVMDDQEQAVANLMYNTYVSKYGDRPND